ncbi:MAG: methionyl-tRNA formyltransferase [Acidimicrobiia bacterium]
MTSLTFMGTPEEAVPALQALAEEFDVTLVITQPDRPRGRSSSPQPSPVKEVAGDLGLDVAQPEDSGELLKALERARPLDLGIVVAYGRILPAEVLEVPARGILNAHFSLLPRWRGAAPVERAIMAGDRMTGVTIIRIDEGLDTGPVLTAQAVDIGPEETGGELKARLARLGARMLVNAIPLYLSGELTPVPQVDEGATYATKISREDRVLDTEGSVAEFIARVRALAPSPGAVLEIDGKPHKILAARPHPLVPKPGTWQAVDGVPVVAVGGEGVEIVRLQPPGKRVLLGEEWLRGTRTDGGTAG